MPIKSPGTPRLLVVDDQVTNLKIIGDILGEFGFDIALAADGDAALLRLEHSAIDLVLLDVLMPGRDGFEICQIIRSHPKWSDIPVIFLSAADDKGLIVRALEVGGVDYVTKPFNKAELISRVRTHVALKLARDRLKQLAEDKDELLGILAHDLKNHLGGMKMSAELLHDRAKKQADARLEQMAGNIRTSTQQMLSFVQEFLANSAADRDHTLITEPIWLQQATHNAVQNYLEAARRKNITLKHSGTVDRPVSGDRSALNQVLDNLLSNAIKFSPPGKSIEVTVQSSPHGGASCQVKDEGPGFTAEDKLHMFNRYWRLSARPTAGEPSTGLGLSIVKKLMEEMDGSIICESAPGQGASFTLTLPPLPDSSRL
ncbi:MAG: hybrid sensor histidine kinase/response regulator [Opitutaceae bacterium]